MIYVFFKYNNNANIRGTCSCINHKLSVNSNSITISPLNLILLQK